jgi:hypothetical protein
VRKLAALALALLAGFTLAACAEDEETGDPMTVAPVAPQGRIAGATLPRQASGYSVMGSLPAPGQVTATYALDADTSVLAVVTLSVDRSLEATPLTDDAWYGQSRCGVLEDLGDGLAQPACIAPLTDGLLTVVGTLQAPADLAQFANAVVAALPD